MWQRERESDRSIEKECIKESGMKKENEKERVKQGGV